MKTTVFTLATALFLGLTTMAQDAPIEQGKCQFDIQITKDNQVVVRQTNATGKEIKIRVYNDAGAKVNTQKYACNGNFKAIYDVTKLNDGNLTFEVLCNNKVIYAETLIKYADGSLSIPQPVNLKQVSKNSSNEQLFTDN